MKTKKELKEEIVQLTVQVQKKNQEISRLNKLLKENEINEQ